MSRKQSSSYFLAKAKCTQSVCTCKVVVTQRVKMLKKTNFNVMETLGTTQNLGKLKEKEVKI